MAHTKIVFLILPRLHLIDFAGPVQVFHEAQDYGADISLEYCGPGEGVSTSVEFPLGKLRNFKEVTLQAGDYLFIPGSEVEFLVSGVMATQQPLMDWVRTLHTSGVKICSVCTGAFFLGRAGVLDGLKCTTHWKRTAELKRRFPAIELVENVLFTEDNGVFTSAGVTSGIDMALFILARLTNENVSFKVAREMVVYMRRSPADPQLSIFMQYRNHVHAGIHLVQDYLVGNIQKKLSLEQLADKGCMSTRSLTRSFKKETGITVNEYTTLIRMTMLKEFQKDPDMSRKQMATQCGLKSERQVIRLLKSAGLNDNRKGAETQRTL